jgi:hypothetical protein
MQGAGSGKGLQLDLHQIADLSSMERDLMDIRDTIYHTTTCAERIEYNTMLDSNRVLTMLNRRRDSTGYCKFRADLGPNLDDGELASKSRKF